MTNQRQDDIELLKQIKPDALGRYLKGAGINIIVPEPVSYVAGLVDVLGLTLIRVEDAFALLSWANDDGADYSTTLIQVHADFTYAYNPYHEFLPNQDMRGRGVEFRLFDYNPDIISAKAEARDGWTVLQPATDKPHGLREAFILDNIGYCWVPSLPRIL